MLSKVVSSTIFKVFGMTRPGIEPRSPGPLANTLTAGPMSRIYIDEREMCVCVCVCVCVRACAYACVCFSILRGPVLMFSLVAREMSFKLSVTCPACFLFYVNFFSFPCLCGYFLLFDFQGAAFQINFDLLSISFVCIDVSGCCQLFFNFD